MDNEIFKEYKETTERTISNSGLIEKMFKNLINIELEKGTNSKEYHKLFEFLKHATKLEYEIIKKIMSSPYCLAFFDIIKSKNCNRLVDLVRNDYDLYELLIQNEFIEEYDTIKDDFELDCSKEEYVCFKMQNVDKEIALQKILNLKKDKIYINILDYYINNTKDEKIKKFLIEEKYNIIINNNQLEKWFFNNLDSIDYLLVECDGVVADRLELNMDSFLNYKNNFYNNSFELIIDSLIDNHIKNDSDEVMYEIKMLSSLFCMNLIGLNNSYKNIEFDIEKYPELYDKKSIRFIDNVYGKYPILEKKLRPVISKKEV